MSDQARIDELGLLTWDGEPMFCPETVQECEQSGLFSTDAFRQMAGQTSWILLRCSCCRQDFYSDRKQLEPYCDQCMAVGR